MNRTQDGVDARAQDFSIISRQSSSSQIRNRANRGLLWQKPDLTKAKTPRVEYPHRIIHLHLLEHSCSDRCHCRLGDVAPNIVAEIEESVSMYIGLCNIKIAANQGYQKRIKQVIDKF